MEATFRVIPMDQTAFTEQWIGKNGYVDIGGFEVTVPGYKEAIPFDFEATSVIHNDDGTYTFGNFDGFLERIYDVDPCHEDDWARNELKIEDITARLLSSANRLNDFYFNACDIHDVINPCFLELKEINFYDENDMEYKINTEVLQGYNKRRVAEQVAEFIGKVEKIPYDRVVREAVEDEYVRKLESKDPSGILYLIDSIQSADYYNSSFREEADFMIDCLLKAAESNNSIYRVGLIAGVLTAKGIEARYVYKDSLESCQNTVADYIQKNNLGNRDWTGGMVYQGGSYVGTISFNGQFWDITSDYGSVDSIILTDYPKWDASICSYGKNKFIKALNKRDVSLNTKIKLSESQCITDGSNHRTIEKDER